MKLEEYEALKDEADTPDEDGDAEEAEVEAIEPDDDDEPARKSAEPSAEQQLKALDRAMVNFEKALRKVFGAEGELTEIPLEGALGYMVPGVVVQKPHEKFKRCDTCNGHGQVLTGSLVQPSADCPRCGSRGYLEKLDRLPPPPRPAPAVESGGETVGNADDEYGVPTWMGNPNLAPVAGH